ncbi:MAG: hypothetical protein ACYDCO_28335 [Armatimonadota bacterium]
MRYNRWLLMLFVLMLGVTSLARASEADEQRQVATQFIRNYFLSDMHQLAQTLPSTGIQQFGPYPFTGKVTLSAPKVRERQALVNFTANTADGRFHRKGALLLWRNKKTETWQMRQVLFYERIPRLFNLPSKSETARDKAHEPAVKEVGTAFLSAWGRNDHARMLALWYDWTKSPRDPEEALSVSNITVNLSRAKWGDPYVQYSAKLTYRYGILSYSMTVKGGLLLVEDKGQWKVRGNTLVLDF